MLLKLLLAFMYGLAVLGHPSPSSSEPETTSDIPSLSTGQDENSTQAEAQNLTSLALGDRKANFYSAYNCDSSAYISGAVNFGCGGTCHVFSGGLWSIYLEYNDDELCCLGGPKPTANCYASEDCTGDPFKAGIWDGWAHGCTNPPGSGPWGSCYLYYDC